MVKNELIEQLFNTLVQLRKLVAQQVQESYEEKSSTLLQFSALIFLIEQPKATVSELASFLRLSKSSATQLVERLVKLKQVARVPDEDDRRVVRLQITQQGKADLALLKEKMTDKMTKFLSKVPEKDLKELVRIHTDLIEGLKQG